MNLTNIHMKKLIGIMTASALEVLGGQAGNDNSSWADDIVQDSLEVLLSYPAKVDDIYNFGKVIAYRRALNFQLREERRREIEEEFGGKINSTLTGQSAEILAADPLEILAYEEMRDRLDELSPLLYATTELHYIQGLDVSAIADMQGVTEEVIYKRLQRAREFVREECIS